MQSILTIAFDSLFVLSCVYFGLLFVLGLLSRIKCPVRMRVETPKAVVPEPVDFSALSPYQLRRQCQSMGIKWRDRHGKNKHLTKSEMLTALGG